MTESGFEVSRTTLKNKLVLSVIYLLEGDNVWLLPYCFSFQATWWHTNEPTCVFSPVISTGKAWTSTSTVDSTRLVTSKRFSHHCVEEDVDLLTVDLKKSFS